MEYAHYAWNLTASQHLREELLWSPKSYTARTWHDYSTISRYQSLAHRLHLSCDIQLIRKHVTSTVDTYTCSPNLNVNAEKKLKRLDVLNLVVEVGRQWKRPEIASAFLFVLTRPMREHGSPNHNGSTYTQIVRRNSALVACVSFFLFSPHIRLYGSLHVYLRPCAWCAILCKLFPRLRAPDLDVGQHLRRLWSH